MDLARAAGQTVITVRKANGEGHDGRENARNDRVTATAAVRAAMNARPNNGASRWHPCPKLPLR